MTIRAIIFDCDGTLVDSEVLANEVLVEYLAELGHAMTVGEAMQAYTGMKMADCVLDLQCRFRTAMPENFVNTFRQRMSATFSDRLRPMEGAMALLASLRLPFYIASSGPREKIQGSLDVTGLRRYFGRDDAIFSAYEIGYWKPNPAFYGTVVEQLALRSAEVIVVEDSLPGIRAALSAGIATIALGAPERLVGDLADAVPASNLLEVGEVIQRLITRSVSTPA